VDRSTGAVLSNSVAVHKHGSKSWIAPLSDTPKVIETGTIRKLRYGFLFAFYSNYDAMLYRLRDIATYWSKIAKFLHPTYI